MKPVSTVPRRNSSARHRLARKAGIGAQPGDQRAIERVGEPVERGLARRRMRDELGDHRVVERRHFAAGFDAAIDADIGRQLQRHDRAGRRQKAVLGILGIDARFDGVTVEANLVLRQRQLFAGGDAELPLDQIEAGDRLGHRMLDLQPGIHFDEPEGAGAQSFRAVGDELDRARAPIADRPSPPRPQRHPSARAAPASCRAPAPPRSPSGGGAAASSRARRDG